MVTVLAGRGGNGGGGLVAARHLANRGIHTEVVIDAMLGYTLRGDPREPIAALIRWANEVAAPTLSLDLPSGLEATTGRVGTPCVRADATLTLALPKRGMLRADEQVGELFVADISIPPVVYRRIGLEADDIFATGPVVRVPRGLG